MNATNPFTMETQVPVSISKASTSSKANPSETTDPSIDQKISFQILLQQKGQQVSPLPTASTFNTEQSINPFEIAIEETPDTALYQELAAAMLGPVVVLPQMRQVIWSCESLPNSSSSAALPGVQELSSLQPLPTVSLDTPGLQETALTPLSNVQQTQIRTASISTAPALQDRKTADNFVVQIEQGDASQQGDLETVALQPSEGSLSKPLFQTPENLPVKVGEAPQLNTDSPDFDLQLGKQLTQTLEQGTQKISVRLTPDHLGTMVVEFTRSQDGSLHIILQASNPNAASLLSQHTAGLSSLLQNNTQVPVFIEVQHQQDSSQSNQQQNQQQGNSQQDAQHQRQQDQKQNQDFLEQLRLGMLPLNTEAS